VHHTRRRLPRPLALLLPAAVLAALAGCAGTGGDDGSASTGGSDGAWSFTDDRGVEVTLDAPPERVASYADYALGLLSNGLEPTAIFGRVDVASDDRFADYDISDAAIVGNSYGEIDLEALAESAPDLIVTGIYPVDSEGTLPEDGPLYAFADVEQQEQIESIAPVVAIEVGGAGQDVIDSVNRLSEALGADPATIDAGREDFDAAAGELRAAAEETGLEVTQMYADAANGIYVAKPADEPEMELYRSYGVDFTDLNPDDGTYYWDIYSWENAGAMFTGDVLLVNVEGFQEDDLLAQPTFRDHPALQAGQIHAWNGAALDYASQADHMRELAQILRDSDDVA
jgi:iron complex transport system substrate-binding protein